MCTFAKKKFMKKILYMLGLALLLSGIYSSCKEDTLEVLRDAELEALDKYVKDNDLTNAKDPSGIYFKMLHRSTDTTLLRPGSKVMLNYHITLLNDTVVYSTQDKNGNNFEEVAFYVVEKSDPSSTNPLQQIEGLHVGLKKMHIGDQAFLVIPSNLAYKAVNTPTPYGSIPRFSTLLVTVYAKRAYPAGTY